MRGAIPTLPNFIFLAWCLIKHRDSFTFTLPSNRSLYQSQFNEDESWTCGAYEMKIEHRILVENIKDHLEDLVVDGRIIMKCVFAEIGCELWAGLNCSGCSGGLLWIQQ
jgi:hypothetical protein